MANKRLPLLPLILDRVPQGLRQALRQEGIPTQDRQPGPPTGRFLLFDSRTGAREPPPAGQVAIDVNTLRKSFDEDPFRALVDERSARQGWEVAGLMLTEQVARVDKRTVRRQLLDRLRAIIQRAGGVWLRISAFPFPYRSALNFRIDYDQYDPSDFNATLDAIAGYERATTHFVSGVAYAAAPEALARLRGLDVGSHGYWHHTYRTTEENLRNIERGIQTLRAAGIEPSGFAAPHGRFHRRLALALEALGIAHSSEFGLVYDELPLLAVAGDSLQIPIHPVCLGLFLEAAARSCDQPAEGAERAAQYFEELVRSGYQRGEPVFLYGHPTGRLGRYPQVLQRVFDAASRLGALWKTNFTELAEWWRARDRIQMIVTRRKGCYTVAFEDLPIGYRVGVECCRKEHVALMPVNGCLLRFSPRALAYEARGAAPSVRPIRLDHSHGLRGRVRQLIDWERVTPVEEIATGDWRNWTKRTLRRFWSD